MDDVVVDFETENGSGRLGLQVKTSLTISAAKTNDDFRSIISKAEETRAKPDFKVGRDGYGFVVYDVSQKPFRSLKRLIDWAKASPSCEDYEKRFSGKGQASKEDNETRAAVRELLSSRDDGYEWDFLRHFIALKSDVIDDLSPDAVTSINNLSEILTKGEQKAPVLWTDLCNHAKFGGKLAAVWTRATLLNSLSSRFDLVGAPKFSRDLEKLHNHVQIGLRQIHDEIGGHKIHRAQIVQKIRDGLLKSRLANITGLPGCGKSVVLKEFAVEEAMVGPIIFLKSDRLSGASWASYASNLGLQHTNIHDLLIEIGAVGTPTVFVDGVDRIKVEHRQVLLDVLDAVFFDKRHANWNVVVTSRDQGLESFRNWLSPALVNKGGFTDVSVGPLSNDEATELAKAVPSLRALLFGDEKVKEIARRPFFASVLAERGAIDPLDAQQYPSTEAELIELWWQRGGLNAEKSEIFKRQRALIDLAENGANSLGKRIPSRKLQGGTIEQFSLLETDQVIQSDRSSNWLSFSHDVFFEWAFYQYLLSLDDEWLGGVVKTGEAPLLGRIVEVLSQYYVEKGDVWSQVLSKIEQSQVRRQWERAWLLGPSSSPRFYEYLTVFESALFEQDGKRLSDFLVWFQAEKTIPNPLMLSKKSNLDAEQRLRVADALSWPSDSQTWSRVINWLVSRWSRIPGSLRFHCLEVFSVWQNMFRDFENPVSEKIVATVTEELSAHFDDRDDDPELQRLGFDRDRLGSYREKLQEILLTSASSYPDSAKRVIASINPKSWDSRKDVERILTYSPLLSVHCAQELADFTFAYCMSDLPNQRLETAKKRGGYWSISSFEENDFGLENIGTPFFPPAPTKEPFFSLLKDSPDVGLDLVRKLSNRAVEGWRQHKSLPGVAEGTPISLSLEFPWGQQEFWGDQSVYIWSRGSLAPQPLESAFLALSYWAHQRLDAGDDIDEILRLVLSGNECVAAIGVAASIVIEATHVSEVSLPIVANFRVWDMDIYRQAQEFGRNLNLLGIDPLHGLSERERDELKYIDDRAHKSMTLRNVAPAALFTPEEVLREAFKSKLTNFDSHLPIHFEEELDDQNCMMEVRRRASEWARMAETSSYQIVSEPEADGKAAIAYVPPQPSTEKEKEEQKEAQSRLGEYNVFLWAKAHLCGDTPSVDFAMEDVISFAKERIRKDSFERLDRAGEGIHQASLAAAASLIQRESDVDEHVRWAWDLLDEIDDIAPNESERFHSKNQMDPRHYLIAALGDVLRKKSIPEVQLAAERLLHLACMDAEDISEMAFLALFNAAKAYPKAAWAGCILASNLACLPGSARFRIDEAEANANVAARDDALRQSREALRGTRDAQLKKVPPAWVFAIDEDRSFGATKKIEHWRQPNVRFDWGVGQRVLRRFPIEIWMQDEMLCPLVKSYVRQLVTWMKDSLNPSWMEKSDRRRRTSHYGEFPKVLGSLIARIAPHFTPDEWYRDFVKPFDFKEHDSGDAVLAEIISGYCCRQILDNPTLTNDAVEIHRIFLGWLASRREFHRTGYRDGHIYGHYVPYIIKDLLLVSVEKASESARFANGDWEDLHRLSEGVSKFMAKAGWVPFVMEQYLKLCSRAGASQPIDAFCDDILISLKVVAKRPELWAGTGILAQISARVQYYAEAAEPLAQNNKHRLLQVLDGLIDLGDRRAVSLEQSEVFRNLQKLH